MPELIAVATTPEAAVAAVQGGADGVCLRPVGLSAAEHRENGFTVQNISTSVAYCRVRGVKAYMDLDALPSDEDFALFEKLARLACRCGCDAIVVSDLGLARFLGQIAPAMPLHGGRKLNVYNLSDLHFAQACGFHRVTLAPELSAERVAALQKAAGTLELAVSVHGRLCMSYGGFCAMDALLESGDPGALECGGRCCKPHGYGSQANGYPLMLRELCLLDRLPELNALGVAALRIESAGQRPEYIAAVASIYRGAETPEEGRRLLGLVADRNALTEGGYGGVRGTELLGEPQTAGEEAEEYFKRVRYEYRHRERQSMEVKFFVRVRRGQSLIAVQDCDGTIFKELGPEPERGGADGGITAAQFRTQLYKLQGTPYVCTAAKVQVDAGLSLTLEQMTELRDAVLQKLAEARSETEPVPELETNQLLRYANDRERPLYTVSVLRADQLSEELLALRPALVYVPLGELIAEPHRVQPFLAAKDTEVVVTLPPVYADDEAEGIREDLTAAFRLGARRAEISAIGHMELAAACGFRLFHGGFALNVRNSYTMRELRHVGLESVGLSWSLTARQIRDLSKAVRSELLVYGRVPVMLTESCIIRNRSGRCSCESNGHVVDEEAAVYPVARAPLCRNWVLSAKKLFLGDRVSRFQKLGLWAARLSFTTENSHECVEVMERYVKNGHYEPNEYTRGRYFPDDKPEPPKKLKKRLFNHDLFA